MTPVGSRAYWFQAIIIASALAGVIELEVSLPAQSAT